MESRVLSNNVINFSGDNFDKSTSSKIIALLLDFKSLKRFKSFIKIRFKFLLVKKVIKPSVLPVPDLTFKTKVFSSFSF